jgi:hypothetical protein
MIIFMEKLHRRCEESLPGPITIMAYQFYNLEGDEGVST